MLIGYISSRYDRYESAFLILSSKEGGVMLRNRVISAAILIVVLLVCVFASPVTRMLFFALAGCLCVAEYSKQLESMDIHCSLFALVFYLILQAVLVLLDAGFHLYAAAYICAVYVVLVSGILRRRVSGNGVIFTVSGLTYPGVLFSAIMIIAVSDIWLETLALGCVATWICDSFALFGGRRFGKHKLAPEISPNKTVEGAVCGFVASLFSGLLVYLLGRWCNGIPWLGGLYSPLPLRSCVLVAAIASTMGQFGDLAESLIKRMIGVKDFSNLIPGHGGMFDRADSLLFSIPTAYFCLRALGF